MSGLDEGTGCGSASEVQRWFAVRGRNREELDGRINRLRQAVETQRGSVLIVKYDSGPTGTTPSASVLYRLPMTTFRWT